MKSCSLLVTLLLVSKIVFCNVSFYKVPAGEQLRTILGQGKRLVVITSKGIYKNSEEGALVRLWASPSSINTIVEEDSCYLIATHEGLLSVSKTRFTHTYIDIPALEKKPFISSVKRDASGKIWVCCEAYGVFTYDQGELKYQYALYPITSVAVTADTSLWIGTMSGLNRMHGKDQFRYNEEGVANFEIPGNVVDRMLVDNKNHLWVITSEGICVFGLEEDGHGHLPSIKFLGSPENVIYSVAYVDGAGYLFASSMGLLLLEEAHPDHVEALEEKNSDKVENKALLHPVSIFGKKEVTMIQTVGKEFWLGTKDEFFKISGKDLKKELMKKAS